MHAHSQEFQKKGDKIGSLLLGSGGKGDKKTQATHITCESITLTVKS